MSFPTFKEMVEFAFYFKLKEKLFYLRLYRSEGIHSHRDTRSSRSINRKCFFKKGIKLEFSTIISIFIRKTIIPIKKCPIENF